MYLNVEAMKENDTKSNKMYTDDLYAFKSNSD